MPLRNTKLHSSLIRGFSISAVILVTLTSLFFPIFPEEAHAEPPQSYDQASGIFSAVFGWVYKDADTIILKQAPGDSFLSNTPTSFTKQDETDDRITYCGDVTFGEDQLTRGFCLVLNKSDLEANLEAKTPVPIYSFYYRQNGGDDTNGSSNAFRDMMRGDGDGRENSSRGYVFFDDDESDIASIAGGGAKPTSDPPTCVSESKIGFGWLLCSILNLIDSTIGGLFGIVDGLLSIDSSLYQNEGLIRAWSYFRNIATFLLILVGLVMIVGQALSKE